MTVPVVPGAPVRGLDLPDFPWDSLAPYKARAVAHPEGIVDLSVGTPVDPTPEVVRRALADAADAPGYPLTVGTADLRAAICEWFERRRGVAGLDSRRRPADDRQQGARRVAADAARPPRR